MEDINQSPQVPVSSPISPQPVAPSANPVPVAAPPPEKHAGGRPMIWTSPDVLQKLVDNYFNTEKQPTLAGLALALDIDRKTLYNYADRDEFFHIIKGARDKVESHYESLAIYRESNPTGVIFALKNMGWADRSDIDHTSKGEKLLVGVISYESVRDANE